MSHQLLQTHCEERRAESLDLHSELRGAQQHAAEACFVLSSVESSEQSVLDLLERAKQENASLSRQSRNAILLEQRARVSLEEERRECASILEQSLKTKLLDE